MDERNKEIFEHFLHVMPVVNEFLSSDVAVAITDREKYLLCKQGKNINLKIEIGDPVRAGTAVARVLESGQRVAVRGDKALFGVPYIAIAVPVWGPGGEIIGAAVAAESVDRQDSVREMAGELTQGISVLASTTEEISAQAEEIAGIIGNLSRAAHDSAVRVKETSQVIDIIKNIAGQTNLLGLNAAIEAARVGDQGRGFGVVAAEIRKLADSTSDSVKQIAGIVAAIQADSEQNKEKLEYIDQVISQVAAAVTHVAGTVQQTSTLVVKLNELADSLGQTA